MLWQHHPPAPFSQVAYPPSPPQMPAHQAVPSDSLVAIASDCHPHLGTLVQIFSPTAITLGEGASTGPSTQYRGLDVYPGDLLLHHT